jgi:hypothetical protein
MAPNFQNMEPLGAKKVSEAQSERGRVVARPEPERAAWTATVLIAAKRGDREDKYSA